ncbi:DUF2971 domain-containing protein [Psychrosphaera aquimarina]|uniref:DUF2971 domain-containing protein n=1 Tax=Psychrosphaera aquimarina TaxID=2044854 RepID=A0ABU3R0R3_9GAMM|nr:DUF2971 domain-containing protein [Psychrosphaera aquimarina]MDU0113271.1 DUF2971 domain-containing protein [Psychrosphaera aquimarina]
MDQTKNTSARFDKGLKLDIEKIGLEISDQLSKLTEMSDNFYHYTSAQGIQGIIENRVMWATDIRFLNDLSEFDNGMVIIIDRMLKHKNPIIAELSKLLKTYYSQTMDSATPYVTSFCIEKDLLSQWRAYANNASGYCMEFDFSKTKFKVAGQDVDSWVKGKPIIYDDEEKKTIVDNSLDELEQLLIKYKVDETYLIEQGSIGTLAGYVSASMFMLACHFKDKSFKEEKEWRVCFILNQSQAEQIREFRISDGGFIPYIPVSFNQKENENEEQIPIPLVSVCLPPSSGINAEKGLRLLLNDYTLNNVLVNKSNIPLKNKASLHW